MADESDYLCREASLLAFNRRVLAMAENEKVPLLERLKFLCIVSSNLDEFFEVRVASLKRLLKQNGDIVLVNGQRVTEVLATVKEEARQIIHRQYQILNEVMIPRLRSENVVFLKRHEWTKEQHAWIEEYFHREIIPVITPIGLDPSHPFPKLLNKSLNFAVMLEGEDAFGRPSDMAIVQAPRILPRVVKLPPELSDGKDMFVFLSSIVHEHVKALFLGMKVTGFYQFRVTRDSELTVTEDDLTNLRSAIEDELHDRQFGTGVRLEVPENCPVKVSDFLLRHFQLQKEDLYRVNGPVNLVRLMAVPDLIQRPDLKYPEVIPGLPGYLSKQGTDILKLVRERDVLLHHPYQSFRPVVDFIQQAAVDPDVVAIKMTIYRTGSKSDLIRGLIQAAQNGKEVTVVVELMARFDEEANVNWAAQLENSGAHVVYGVFGYKVHAKMSLVVRKEGGQLRRYAHLGTGNYHQGTSKIYTDFGLLTSDPDITSDVNDIFIQITGLGQAGKLRKIYQSPFTLYDMLIASIRKETENAKAGKPARIMAKMNSLIETGIIQELYKASQEGVKIDLVVRGMCALKPGVQGLSENIRVRSIVGRLLEHARVYYFHNGGADDLYIASADWMVRNFFHRVETCTPITDRELKRRILEDSFGFALKDNQQAWLMTPDGGYVKIEPQEGEAEINMQELLLRKYSNDRLA